jgi:hypothetical protein
MIRKPVFYDQTQEKFSSTLLGDLVGELTVKELASVAINLG